MLSPLPGSSLAIGAPNEHHFDRGESSSHPENLLRIRISGKAEYDTQKSRHTNGNANP
jgi:hypothetical protein